ncbi:MAG: Sua5 family C-terminal domain-containing protein [Caldilineaceae bacterium]
MAADELRTRFPEAVVAPLGAPTTAEVMARRLYGAMRALDAQDVELIFVHEVPASGLGLAINDLAARDDVHEVP